MPSDKVIFGGIIKHTNGCVGFKISFTNKQTANLYKDMFNFIIRSDDIETEMKRGYYDE